ncbi:surface antigen-domain-containing protein [Yarrowia lipolytica]|uniref:YALI0D04554p n=2 Tax=Yarrowia lipolytica TaxID=4952 RepID=Q6CAA3_YARLI|nr:YALI0D04554p [Yarrowia lipolytica CLIB122]AOW03575.1 hypothetical protein YALI1_D05705g [Yarrowia lipolytica]KAB8284654.1 surface antigen-domain-containing protein [Yarrowia lipolytica]KAE8171279.1 surface antigen-domain-containing protein [Yarrowia lipolytica]KAJ8054797.1 surface antigen-domain-containing protein [Yarrowia lipolytica]QNP97648.1 SAM50-like protein SPAC17C9.06 [Yarrowia lipolytica]|eukprot:XP_502409.1 YALI0D04554p [Yarrowia lipolytica CLIB122]
MSELTILPNSSKLDEAIVLNGTRPVEVEAVEVTGISLRDPFLKRQLRALLQPGLTVKSLFDGVEVVSEKLAAVPVLSDVNISLDSKPSEKLAKLGGISVKATISAIQKDACNLTLASQLRDDDANAIIQVTHPNFWNGSETVFARATFGTLTTRSYSGSVTIPIGLPGSPLWTVAGYLSRANVPSASHQQILKGVKCALTKTTGTNTVLQAGVEQSFRTVTEVGEAASDAVRAAAGDSAKTSAFFAAANDTRDDPFFPTSGRLLSVLAENAFKPNDSARGLVHSDVAFQRIVARAEGSVATPDKDVVFNYGLSAGSTRGAVPLLDRFYMGGVPGLSDDLHTLNTVSLPGFSRHGLGPKDGRDSVGGQSFAKAGVSVFTAVPRLISTSPLKLHFFANAGHLSNEQHLLKTLQQAPDNFSASAGVGFVYRSPQAQFDLTWAIPVQQRTGDVVRPGGSIGLSLMWSK